MVQPEPTIAQPPHRFNALLSCSVSIVSGNTLSLLSVPAPRSPWRHGSARRVARSPDMERPACQVFGLFSI